MLFLNISVVLADLARPDILAGGSLKRERGTSASTLLGRYSTRSSYFAACDVRRGVFEPDVTGKP